MSGWTIRDERAGEEGVIHALTQRAFEGHPFSDGDEADVIDRLRADGDLVLSLVAVAEDKLIGQATYSEARLSNGETGWMVLGPIAVEPSRQGEGIGRALIAAGDHALKARGASGLTVLGDPAIYRRFGFELGTPLTLMGELGQYLQAKSYGPPIPAATIGYAPAFG